MGNLGLGRLIFNIVGIMVDLGNNRQNTTRIMFSTVIYFFINSQKFIVKGFIRVFGKNKQFMKKSLVTVTGI